MGQTYNCICNEQIQTEHIKCAECNYYFHPDCIGVSLDEQIALDIFICKFCAPYSPTIFIMKNERNTSAILRQSNRDQILKKHKYETEKLEDIKKKINSIKTAIKVKTEKKVFSGEVNNEELENWTIYINRRNALLKVFIENEIELAVFDRWVKKNKKSLGDSLLDYFKGVESDERNIKELELAAKEYKDSVLMASKSK